MFCCLKVWNNQNEPPTIRSFLGFGFDAEILILRRIYPFLLGVVALVGFCTFQARQFKRLYEHIKNDK